MIQVLEDKKITNHADIVFQQKIQKLREFLAGEPKTAHELREKFGWKDLDEIMVKALNYGIKVRQEQSGGRPRILYFLEDDKRD